MRKCLCTFGCVLNYSLAMPINGEWVAGEIYGYCIRAYVRFSCEYFKIGYTYRTHVTLKYPFQLEPQRERSEIDICRFSVEIVCNAGNTVRLTCTYMFKLMRLQL